MRVARSLEGVARPNRFSASVLVVAGLVIGLVAALLGWPPQPAEGVAGFGDVDDGRYYTEAVQWAVDEGIVDAGACFWPESPVTRGDAAVALWRMQGSPETEAHSFVDVLDPTQNDAVSWLSSTGITTGTSATTFAPNVTLNRAHIATFLWRLAGKPNPPRPHSFVDVHAGWQQDPVSWLSATGITTGTSASTFSPENTLNRAQLVTFLYRYNGKPAVTVDRRTPYCDPTTSPLTSVAAGDNHLCGLRSNGVIDCWGNNKSRQSDAPNARFTAVSARGLVSCGILTNGTVRCWGNAGSRQLDVPTGVFKAISVGQVHVCGIRENGAVECWGSGADGVDPPAGQFTTISAGSAGLTCGLRTNGKPECWSNPRWQPSADWSSDPPAGRFIAFEAVDSTQACGLRDYGAVQCWGWGYRQAPMQRNVPEGVFRAISGQDDHVCGLRDNGTAECWSTSSYRTNGREYAPDGAFKTIAAGDGFTCGLRVDGSLECWYSSASEPVAVPEGSYTAVSAKGRASCGVLEDGAAVCWGDRGLGRQPEVLRGVFSAVSAGDNSVCGILESGALKCTESSLWQDPPTGRFTSISGGGLTGWLWCGLRTDGTAECWGRGSESSLKARCPRFYPRPCIPTSQLVRVTGAGCVPMGRPSAGGRQAVLGADLRDAEAPWDSDGGMFPKANSRQSKRAAISRAGSSLTAPSNVGQPRIGDSALVLLSRLCQRHGSAQYRRASIMCADYSRTARPDAGDPTTTENRWHLQASSLQFLQATIVPAGCARTAASNAGV